MYIEMPQVIYRSFIKHSGFILHAVNCCVYTSEEAISSKLIKVD